jgi:hypothetical protein
MMARDRSDDECDINSLYGCPGAKGETETGIGILHATLRDFGLSAFTDEFMTELAARHRAEDEDMGRRAEAAYRREQRNGSVR